MAEPVPLNYEGVPNPETNENGDTEHAGNDIPEIMDLTGDTSPVKPPDVETASEPVPRKGERPLGTQEMKKFAQDSLETLDATGKETQQPIHLDDDSSDSSDDDNDMIDDSGITLNLQEEDEGRDDEQPETITIDSSSDEEEPEKGRPKVAKTSPLSNGLEPLVTVEVAKPNGAIAVSTSLRLGKNKVAKITRRPLSEAISAGQVQVVDYSNPQSAQSSGNSHLSKVSESNLPSGKPAKDSEVEVIDLVSDPVDSPNESSRLEVTRRVSQHSIQTSDSENDLSNEDDSGSDVDDIDTADDEIIHLDDDDDDDEGAISENESSASSVGSNIWSLQQRYYVKQSSPPLLPEGSRMLFTEDVSSHVAAQKILTQPEPKKRKICDICLEPHLTESCNMLKVNNLPQSAYYYKLSC
ncbi:hypothetical protein ABW20_dc0105831 [Dactylellina cionopaga]|nr:hypothetical protein ABW20_dc0105831 [Dactylellina cionopaga]